MNKDETLFYQKLSEILQETYSRQISFVEDNSSLRFQKDSLHDINALALEFQPKCATLFNVHNKGSITNSVDNRMHDKQKGGKYCEKLHSNRFDADDIHIYGGSGACGRRS